MIVLPGLASQLQYAAHLSVAAGPVSKDDALRCLVIPQNLTLSAQIHTLQLLVSLNLLVPLRSLSSPLFPRHFSFTHPPSSNETHSSPFVNPRPLSLGAFLSPLFRTKPSSTSSIFNSLVPPH